MNGGGVFAFSRCYCESRLGSAGGWLCAVDKGLS